MSIATRIHISRRAGAVLAAAAAVAALGITAVAGPAWATGGGFTAATGDPLTTAKARVDARITKALTRLDKLPAADAAQLAAQLSSLRQQLTDLKTKVDAAADLASLKADVKSAFALLTSDGTLGQVRAVVATDRISAAVARIEAIEPRLDRRFGGQGALSDLEAKVADAKAKTTGLAGNVLSGQTSPADAKVALIAAQADIKAARADLKTLRTGGETGATGAAGANG